MEPRPLSSRANLRRSVGRRGARAAHGCDAHCDAAPRQWPVRVSQYGRLDGLGRIWLFTCCWCSTAWAVTAAFAAAGECRGGFAGSTLRMGSGWQLEVGPCPKAFRRPHVGHALPSIPSCSRCLLRLACLELGTADTLDMAGLAWYCSTLAWLRAAHAARGMCSTDMWPLKRAVVGLSIDLTICALRVRMG